MSQKERIKDNKEKIKMNKQLPYLVANVVEVTLFVLFAHSCSCWMLDQMMKMKKEQM
jgi:hypothetical protein